MSEHYTMSDYAQWREAGLKDYIEFSDCVDYINQIEYGDGALEGEWWYVDDEKLTIYYGTFGNYNSPGASHYTYANVYDDKTEFLKALDELQRMPEYAECICSECDTPIDDCGCYCPDCGELSGLYGKCLCEDSDE